MQFESMLDINNASTYSPVFVSSDAGETGVKFNKKYLMVYHNLQFLDLRSIMIDSIQATIALHGADVMKWMYDMRIELVTEKVWQSGLTTDPSQWGSCTNLLGQLLQA